MNSNVGKVVSAPTDSSRDMGITPDVLSQHHSVLLAAISNDTAKQLVVFRQLVAHDMAAAIAANTATQAQQLPQSAPGTSAASALAPPVSHTTAPGEPAIDSPSAKNLLRQLLRGVGSSRNGDASTPPTRNQRRNQPHGRDENRCTAL